MHSATGLFHIRMKVAEHLHKFFFGALGQELDREVISVKEEIYAS